MSNFYVSTFYDDGYRDGYAAIFADCNIDPSPPKGGAIEAEYMLGWEHGLEAGRCDYWEQKEEQSYYDWQEGL